MTLSEQIEANKLTIAELEAVVKVLDDFKLERRHTVLKAALAKMHWHIAASRNEVEYS